MNVLTVMDAAIARNGHRGDNSDDLALQVKAMAIVERLAEALELLSDVYDAMGAPRGPARIKADAALAAFRGDV